MSGMALTFGTAREMVCGVETRLTGRDLELVVCISQLKSYFSEIPPFNRSPIFRVFIVLVAIIF